MMDNVDHILNKEKILKNFSISKYISSKEINKLKENIQLENSYTDNFDEILKEKIVEYTDNYIKTHKIPGLIIKNKSEFNVHDKSSIKIYKNAAEFAYKLKFEKKLTKPEMLFFIISLVSHLGFTQKDFDNMRGYSNDSDDLDDLDNTDDSDDLDDSTPF